MPEHTGRRSTFYTVLAVSIIVALIISLFSNILNFNFLKDVMDREAIETGKATSEIAFHNIENQFGAATKANAMIMVGSLELQNAISSENANAIRYSVKALSAIVDSVPSVVSYDMYMPGCRSAVINSSHVSYDVSPDDVYDIFPWLEYYNRQNKRFLILPEGSYNYPEYNSYLTYIAGLPVNTASSQNITAVHLDPDIFSKFINEDDGTFLIFDEDQNLIYQTEGRDYAETALSEMNVNGRSYKVRCWAAKHDKQRIYVSQMSSSIIPLDFVYITPSGISNHIMPYFQSFFVNAIILIFMNLLVISFLTLKNDKVYTKRISAIVPDEAKDKDRKANFDDFADVLEKKFKNINSSYENAQPILIQNSLRMALLGRATEKELLDLEELLPYDKIRIAIARKRTGASRDSLASILADELNKLPQDVICYMTTIRSETIIITNANENNFGLKDLQSEDDSLILFLSSIHETSAENLRIAYHEACEVLPYGFMYNDLTRFTYASIAPDKRISQLPQDRYLTRFDEALQMQSTPDVTVEILTSVISNLLENNVTIEYCRVVTRDLVTIFHKNIVNHGIDPVGLLGYDIRTYYEQIRTINGYEAWMKVSLSNYFDYLDELRQTQTENRIKEQIDAILEDAPSNLLSLDYIATKMDMRADELSRLFKTCYGINYSEYIRDRKMEYAKQLLEQGLMVKDISMQLGYNAPQYFIKVFKQATGITPNQYSKLMKAQGERK